MRPRFPEAQSIRAVVVLLCLALVPAATLGAPRDTVDSLASLIDNNFYDPQKARTIAAELRQQAQAGAFDRVADPRDLASLLTRKLKPFDHHFNVTWSGQPAETQDPRANYGFRSVEMLPGAIGYTDMRFFADFAQPGDPARAA